jgi:hypothetical protein
MIVLFAVCFSLGICEKSPTTLDHLGELLEWLETLPLQRSAPVVEETTGPTFSLVIPELAAVL